MKTSNNILMFIYNILTGITAALVDSAMRVCMLTTCGMLRNILKLQIIQYFDIHILYINRLTRITACSALSAMPTCILGGGRGGGTPKFSKFFLYLLY